jgi:phage-related protein
MAERAGPKPLFWIGSSLDAIRRFPQAVRSALGFAIFQAQLGGKHVSAKPLSGFGGAGVLEVVEDHDRNAYRLVYAVKFRRAVYVLHTFQKKSKKGIATPRVEIEIVRQRLKAASLHYEEWFRENQDVEK